MSRRRQYPTFPFVGVGILIKKDERYLMIKRAAEPDKGLWTVPGGLIEVGEKAADAAAREVLEETGLLVDVGERLGVVDKIVYDDEGKVLYHFIIMFYSATPVGGELQAMDDALDARWVTLEELQEYELSKSLVQIMNEIGLLNA
ncbi:MAG: NUDIX hydrolase [Candidatus Bathyarchaeota archaeon]|nr:NUDIX hydrolase [Candidatus Bathyarchaeota archaeon]